MTKQVFIWVFVVAVVVATALLVYRRSSTVAGLTTPTPSPSATGAGDAVMSDIHSEAPTQQLPDGLQIQDVTVGTGLVAQAGKTVTVNYTGWLTNGTKFDSSLDHGTPFQFTLGQGEVIKGWDEGVVGMKIGGKRRLLIPSALAYGAQSVGGGLIPPNADLIFEVELLGVK